jgi:hypothetical protein
LLAAPLGGMLACKMMKTEAKPRATVFTLMHESSR